MHLKRSCSLRESERRGPSGEEASAHWPPQLPVRRHPGSRGRLGGGTLRCSGQLERVAGAGLGNSASRDGGRQDGGCRRGSLLFSSPLTRFLLPRHRPRSREELSNQLHPLLEALSFPPPVPCAVSSSRRPRCPRPSVRPPSTTPITSAAGPAPPFGPPERGRAGRRAGRCGPGIRKRPPPALASAVTAVALPGRRWGPGPATAAAPGGGGGMEAPPPPLPPRSPAEGREGSAPRQDPPLRPPPATSTLPSLPPWLRGFSRGTRARARKGGKQGGNPPARGRRGGGRGGAERSAEPPPPPRTTVSRSASRWRCGRGWGAEHSGTDSGCAPAAARAPRLPAPGPRSPPGGRVRRGCGGCSRPAGKDRDPQAPSRGQSPRALGRRRQRS